MDSYTQESCLLLYASYDFNKARTVKDRERNEKKEGQAMSRTSKKKEKTRCPELKKPRRKKLKKKIPRLTVRESRCFC